MATTRIFGYSANSGLTIPGTTRYGNIYAQDFSASLTLITGITWYMGPDEDLGYIISNKYTPPPPPTIGDTYQGGIVFYITAPTAGATSGTAGLISKTADRSGYCVWGCYGTAISGADGTAIGTGNQNTIDIHNAGCSDTPIAANYCYDLTDGTYSDWWLPSKYELNQMYIQKSVIGEFVDNYYWSSSERENSTDFAWVQDFGNGDQSNDYKLINYYVRAVRGF